MQVWGTLGNRKKSISTCGHLVVKIPAYVGAQKAGMLRMSRKASLLGVRGALPAALEDLTEGTLAPGYVASVTGDAVFVRFLGSLTGRAGALGLISLGPPALQLGH